MSSSLDERRRRTCTRSTLVYTSNGIIYMIVIVVIVNIAVMFFINNDRDGNGNGDEHKHISQVLMNTRNQTTFLHRYCNQTFTPPQTPGAFLHIGKTGGSTLSFQLRNGCHSFMEKPCKNETELPSSQESVISKLTSYFHIPDFDNGRLFRSNNENDYQFFVITIRDPLSRWISTYHQLHPYRLNSDKLNKWKDKEWHTKYKRYKNYVPSLKKLQNKNNIYACFETLEEYAQLLSNFTNFNMMKDEVHAENLREQDCDVQAKATFYHIRLESIYLFVYDLRQVLSMIQKNLREKIILSVRTEFLWTDWATANRWLGDDSVGIVKTGQKIDERNSTKVNSPVKMDLSDQGRKNLCLALESEYHLYFKVLQLSVNLGPKDREASLAIARKNCPWLDLNFKDVPEVFESRDGLWEL